MSGARSASSDGTRTEQEADRAPKALFVAHAAYLARLLHRLLGSAEDVEDVVQEVFAVVVRREQHVRSIRVIRPWLTAVAVKKARKLLRWRRLKSTLGLESADLDRYVDPDASTSERDLVMSLYQSLNGVATDSRITWVLYWLEGHTMDEVARICGCSLSTVKRRLQLAERHVRSVMGAHHDRIR